MDLASKLLKFDNPKAKVITMLWEFIYEFV